MRILQTDRCLLAESCVEPRVFGSERVGLLTTNSSDVKAWKDSDAGVALVDGCCLPPPRPPCFPRLLGWFDLWLCLPRDVLADVDIDASWEWSLSSTGAVKCSSAGHMFAILLIER